MTRFAAVGDGRLAYEVHGEGPALLFIHASSVDRRMWAPQVAALSARYQVVTYDQRGFGESSVPVGPFAHHADAAALLEYLGIEKAVVIGLSIGALYALELALAHPERVVGLASLCMSGLGEPPFPADIGAMFGELKRLARGGDLRAAKALWSTCGWFASVRAHHDAGALVDAMLAAYSGWYWLHDSPSTNLVPPARQRLEELRVPTLVIDGALDLPYNTAIAAILARRIPHATHLTLPAAGHMANLEAPEAVTRALDELAIRAFA